MSHIEDLHREMMRYPEYRAAHEAHHLEFEIAGALIGARATAGMTQTQVAEQMKTTQSAVARLEGGKSNPSMRTLDRFAKATRTRVRIWFEPLEVKADEPEPSEIQPEKSETRQPETELAAALD